MSISGPWVSAGSVLRSGDIWNTEILLTFAFSDSFTLSGGGAVSVTSRKQACAFTQAAVYGQADYGTSIYGPGVNLSGGGTVGAAAGFTSTFAISGGGTTTVAGARKALGSLSVPGGGAVVATTSKRAVAIVAEDSYGQARYGTAGYGPGVLLHGGGTVLGAGGFDVSVILSGGGAGAATGTKYTRALVPGCTYGHSTYGGSLYGPFISLSGGGNLAIVPNPRRYAGVAITGGGGVLLVGHKAALASNVENCYGQAIYGVGVYSTALHIHGGGALTTAGVKHAQTGMVQTGGGTPAVDAHKTALVAVFLGGGGAPTGRGEKHAVSHSAGAGYGVAIYGVATYSSLPGVYGAAIYGIATYSSTYNSYGLAIYGAATYGATDTSMLHVHGGGRLYGPFPYVLSPRVRMVNGQGLVHIRTGQAGVKVNTSSVRITVPA